jgi:hypothetical protein
LGADPGRASLHMKATSIHGPQFCKTTVPTKRPFQISLARQPWKDFLQPEPLF